MAILRLEMITATTYDFRKQRARCRSILIQVLVGCYNLTIIVATGSV